MAMQQGYSGNGISLEINLPAGHHTMRAWFKGLNGDDLCGAYYVQLKRLL
jgi:hypothetical protein